MKQNATFLFFLLFLNLVLNAQNTNKVFYAGAGQGTVFYDVKQLSNNNLLIAGVTNSLSWVPLSATVSTLNLPDTVLNGTGTNKIAFLMYCSEDLNDILNVVKLNTNEAEDIRFIKFTNLPGDLTGNIFISGNTSDTKANNGGYFIGKLDNNFVNGIPTAFSWAAPIYAASGSTIKSNHPWDVNGTGDVYYGTGESHAANWAAIHSLNGTTGLRRVVNNWVTHWYETSPGVETEFKYGKANTFTGPQTLKYSGIPLKHSRCDFRSMTMADYTAVTTDENGSLKMGKMPFDFFFKQPCDLTGNTTGKGYNNNANGYRTAGGSSSVMGLSSITCDKRNNWVYLGINSKTILPDGQPDFEPAIIAYNNDELIWWDRLYKEATINIGVDTVPNISTPDQYIDAIAIDYSKADNTADAELVVAARQHGNNTISLWNARKTVMGVTSSAIVANPLAKGFKDRFMGSNGNIHIGWLGRLKAKTGILNNVTYVGELIEGATNYGAASTDPHLDGWPDPNVGNADMNTTYMQKNQMQVTGDGHVVIIAQGRRTLTTANAYQKMPPPSSTLKGAWNYFVREYRSDLSYAKYSSLVAGAWNTATGADGDNTTLWAVCKTQYGIIAVGNHNGTGNNVPVINEPGWGTASYISTSGLIAYLQHDSIASTNDKGLLLTSLAVGIQNFNIACIGNKTILKFKNEHEVNVVKYELEFSADGVNFITKEVIANRLIKNYELILASNQKGFYRLKIVKLQGEVILSGIVALDCNNSKSAIEIFEQPAVDLFTIKMNNVAINKANLKILNSEGKIVYKAVLLNNLIQLSAKKLKLLPGVYIVQIMNNNKLFSKKMLVAY